ncbi:MAG: hypothetical protein ACLFRT_15375 [Actinomycetota bacterium]
MSIWSLFQRARDSDRGASAILVAASLLLLMGFAAIAVDAGIGFSERRQQASAADVGALAALQFAKTTLGVPDECNTGLSGDDLAACRGAVEALDVIEGTLPGRYTDDDWTACNDPDDDTLGYTQDSQVDGEIIDCISFTENFQRSRVVLPGSEVDTAFSRPLGFDFIGVGAFAEAGLDLDIIGGVRPFAIGPSGADADHACFSAGDNNSLDIHPCGPGTEGNYGKLDVFLYGNESYPTPQICSGNNTQRFVTNMVSGSDHPMQPRGAKPAVHEEFNCANMANPVNQFHVTTGISRQRVEQGLFDGVTTPPDLEGVLLCKGSESSDTSREDYPLATYESKDCVDILGEHPEAIDHTPLWEYIRSGAPGTSPGGACAPGQADDRPGMEDCLDWWKDNAPHSDSLFSSDVVTSPRFMAVPILDQDPGSGSSVKYNLEEFRPVYLETIYYHCTGNSCQIVHSPGEDSTGPCPSPLTNADWSCGWPQSGNMNLEAVSAFVLTLDMLPADIADKFPFQDGTIVYNLYK